MNTKYIKILFIIGLLLLVIPFILDPSMIKQLNKGDFTSIKTSTSSVVYKSNEQMQVIFSYENPTFTTRTYTIKGVLKDQTKSKTYTIPSHGIITDSFIFTAPQAEGLYTINFYFSGQNSLDKHTFINIKVDNDVKPTNNDLKNLSVNTKTGDGHLIIYSNVSDVKVSYEHETKTVGSNLILSFYNIPQYENFEFTASKDGYITKKFNVYMGYYDVRYNLDMKPIGSQTDDINQIDNVSQIDDLNQTNQTDLIKVIVIAMNQNNESIENCKIILNNETKFTDEYGETTFNVPTGNYLVSILHDSYVPVDQKYNLNQNTRITVKLQNKDDFTGTMSMNTTLDDSNYMNYVPIVGGLILILSITLLKRNTKKKHDKR